MALNKSPYKGCRDFFPKDMRGRDFLFNRMKKVAESFAYEAYDGPMLEEVELYKAKSGEELINEQIYSFTDRGDRFVAMRPEMTPTLARMVANIHKQAAKPLRWYSIPNLFRYEKPQRGRVREHWQFNVDIFGAKENLGEIETLNLAVNFLKSFGANESMFSIRVNDRKVVDGFFNKLLKVEADKAYRLYKIIDKSMKVSQEALDEMLAEQLSTDQIDLFKKYLAIKTNDELIDFIVTHELKDEAQSLLIILSNCEKLGIDKFIQYDPAIVRGLDYYTGLVFEIFDLNPKNRRAIAGGGAYANLLQIFNENPLAGVGFGLGDVTLRDFLEVHNLLPDFSHAKNNLFISYTSQDQEATSMKFANELREKGLNIELNLGVMKFNKIFKTAENKGHKFVAIVEPKDNIIQAQIKNLEDKSAEFFEITKIEEIANHIQ